MLLIGTDRGELSIGGSSIPCAHAKLDDQRGEGTDVERVGGGKKRPSDRPLTRPLTLRSPLLPFLFALFQFPVEVVTATVRTVAHAKARSLSGRLVGVDGK